MKRLIIIIGFGVAMAIPFMITCHNSLMQSCIGKKIIVQKDTFTVVDYSAIRQTFIMHNGKEFGEDFTVKTIEEQEKK